MPVKFSSSRAEMEIIIRIAHRARTLYIKNNEPLHYAIMDISACHENGCRLKLQELLHAGEGDFFHDVAEIRRHIDRKTGKLDGEFWPRFAATQ
jgi:hypothetical protein